MGSKSTPFDQIKMINSTLFEKFKFRANKKIFHAPGNSMLNNVLETAKEIQYPLYTLLINYSKLGLPIFGVNLPNLFVLTYKSDKLQFYINVFNRGLIFLRRILIITFLNLAYYHKMSILNPVIIAK